MTLYNYIATDLQGKQIKGQLPADDKNDLLEQLTKERLNLISCEKVLIGHLEPQTEAPPEAAPVASRWPVETSSQYIVILVIFAACVLLGYIIGS